MNPEAGGVGYIVEIQVNRPRQLFPKLFQSLRLAFVGFQFILYLRCGGVIFPILLPTAHNG